MREASISIPVYITSVDEPDHPEVTLSLGNLLGPEGNAFVILGRFDKALAEAGIDAAPYLSQARSGDYEHLLAVVRSAVTVVELGPLRPEDLTSLEAEA